MESTKFIRTDNNKIKRRQSILSQTISSATLIQQATGGNMEDNLQMLVHTTCCTSRKSTASGDNGA